MVLGRDYDATFAPTAAPASIRMLAVLATRWRYAVKVGDVETAFLIPKMDKVVYVKALLWYEQIVASISNLPVPTALPPYACRQLLKGVPGIKQGSRLFYMEIKKVLLANGYSVHPADPCVYFRLPTKSNPSIAAVAVWVDDIFAVIKDDKEWQALLVALRAVFAIVDKGDIRMFLGMEILQSADKTSITLSQRISIDNLLSRAATSMKSKHPAPTPCVAGFVFTKADCPAVAQPRPARMPEFRGLLALANYISVWTRPDITYVVNKLCKSMANPASIHIDALERMLRYLIGTRELGLVYTFDESAQPVIAYSDSSHMDCVDSSRSTLAYLFFFYGQIVTWYSKLHGYVTTCSNHSEYAAMFQAAKEAQSIYNWLVPLLSVLGTAVVPIPIFNDNDGASALALDPVGRFKNKHVRMEHHYTQELVAANIIVPVRVSTDENKSDLLTKALGPTVFPKIARSLVGPTGTNPDVPRSAIGPASACPPARILMLRVADCDDREDGVMGSELHPDTAREAWMEHSRTINSVFKVLAYQQKRVGNATAYLIGRLGLVDDRVVPLPELPDLALPLPAFLDALAVAIVNSSRPAEPDVVPLHVPIPSSLPIPYPHPLSPTAPLWLSPLSREFDAELLEEDDQLYASQSSGNDAPGEFKFSDHFRVYDFGNNFAFCAQCCTASASYGGCSFSNWNAFRVWPDTLCFSANAVFDKSTLSGFPPSVNSIVISYLGKFCVATYRACVNVPPRESFCNHCRRWGHSFSLDSCTVRGYGSCEAPAALPAPVPWCAYCQKAGHVVESCRRRIGDRGYLHKRKRR